MDNSTKTKTAIYVRVSTEDQVREGYSIDAQKYKLTQYCQLREWEIVRFYIEEGVSGKNLTGRPEVMKMIKDIKSQLINNILVYKLDRLTRSSRDTLDLIDLVNKYGVRINSLSESIDTTTHNGRMMLKMLGDIAENERETIAERFQLGKEQKARNGKYTSSTPPFGYDWDNVDKKLVIKENEALWVRKIFKLYLENQSIHSITKMMSSQSNMLTRNHANYWNKATINKMLKNPTYCGKIRHRQKDPLTHKYITKFIIPANNVEPIIDDDLFNTVNNLINKRAVANVKKFSSEDYTFGDVLYCACGRKMICKYSIVYNHKKTIKYSRYYYRCTKKHDHGLYYECTQPTISNKIIESQFLNFFKNLKFINSELSPNDKLKLTEIESDLKGLESSLDKIVSRRKALQLKLLDGIINNNDFLQLQQSLAEDEQNLHNLLHGRLEEKKKISGEILTPEQINMRKELAKQINISWTIMNKIEKKTFVSTFLQRVNMKDGHIDSIDFK